MADLVTQCSTPECLRGVGLQGGQCLPCQKSMPPMKNPNSPYAFSNNKPPSFAFTPPVTPPVANLPSPGSTNPILTPQVKQNVKKWMTGKTDDEKMLCNLSILPIGSDGKMVSPKCSKIFLLNMGFSSRIGLSLQRW